MPPHHERRRASASLGLRRESIRQESASCDDSHWPSIPALRGPSPAARVRAPRRELLPLWGQRSGRIGHPSRKRGGPMNISQPFIDRPVATTLLTLGVALAGAIAF